MTERKKELTELTNNYFPYDVEISGVKRQWRVSVLNSTRHIYLFIFAFETDVDDAVNQRANFFPVIYL